MQKWISVTGYLLRVQMIRVNSLEEFAAMLHLSGVWHDMRLDEIRIKDRPMRFTRKKLPRIGELS